MFKVLTRRQVFGLLAAGYSELAQAKSDGAQHCSFHLLHTFAPMAILSQCLRMKSTEIRYRTRTTGRKSTEQSQVYEKEEKILKTWNWIWQEDL